eukprot:597533-Prymnesium_polylepis.1
MCRITRTHTWRHHSTTQELGQRLGLDPIDTYSCTCTSCADSFGGSGMSCEPHGIRDALATPHALVM